MENAKDSFINIFCIIYHRQVCLSNRFVSGNLYSLVNKRQSISSISNRNSAVYLKYRLPWHQNISFLHISGNSLCGLVYVYGKILLKFYVLHEKHRTNGDDVTQNVNGTGVTWQICDGPICTYLLNFILHRVF